MTYNDNLGKIESSIRVGIATEEDSDFGPVVRSFTEEQIRWVAAWLAGEGFGKD